MDFTFDARSLMLDKTVEDDWEPAIRDQWRANQASVRTGLLAEYGVVDGDAKIANFIALGPAPISVIHEHNDYLREVRSAFTHGDYYPALVGGCTLGERVLNELLRELLPDFIDHPATTKRVRHGSSITNWISATDVLSAWGVISEKTAADFLALQSIRHEAVHYGAPLAGHERERALSAIKLLQEIIQDVFAAIGGPPHYMDGVAGVSIIALDAETIPLIKRIFLPRAVLVSPAHALSMREVPGGAEVTIYDDADYPQDELTDAEYAVAYPTAAATLSTLVNGPPSTA